MVRFRDRREAGRKLASRLAGEAGPRTTVIGLPRGGVVVAAEVARALGAPLDVIVVRKLGHPSVPEFGLGAIAEGGVVYTSGGSLRGLEHVLRREADELERRVERYRGGRPPPDLRGRTALLVDDGIATGGTAHAAARAARALGAARVVVAAPVIAPSSVAALGGDADEVVCLASPESFGAVGAFYEDFAQVEDDEVLAALIDAAAGR
jgi:predicted phosphoribosyltransferase